MIAGMGHQQCFGGWSSSLISKIWRTVMNSKHWLFKFKVCIITTVRRQRNSKHFLIWWLMNYDFLQIYFIFARFCEFQKLFKKIKVKELLKKGVKAAKLTKVGLFQILMYCSLYNGFEADRCVFFKWKRQHICLLSVFLNWLTFLIILKKESKVVWMREFVIILFQTQSLIL
jgi:hypothetical protein